MIRPSRRLLRQSGTLPPQHLRGKSVYQIGAGGIGSWTALALGKMGIPEITIVDDDRVEDVNVSTQAYADDSVGQLKVEALYEVLQLMAPETSVNLITRRFTEQMRPSGIVISAVDSMASRNVIWQAVKANAHAVQFYIEARMSIEFLWMFSFDPNDTRYVSRYEKMLYSDADVQGAACTERAIVYTVFAAAAEISKHVKKHLTGEFVPWQKKYDLAHDILIATKDTERENRLV